MPIANSYDATWFLTLILRSLNYGSIRRVCYLWSANISVQSIWATGNCIFKLFQKRFLILYKVCIDIQMSHLQDDHPKVYQHFQDGLHVIRRRDCCWAGLSLDLVNEQVLMRSMKTNGGLTRGRGMTEQQRLISLSMPACGEVNRAMQELY